MIALATLHSRQVEGILVVRISGYLNGGIGAEVGKIVDGLIEAGGRRLLLDFEDTRLMNSVGISSITSIVERMARFDGKSAFCALTGMNQEILRMTGATRRVELFATEAEALAWLAGGD